MQDITVRYVVAVTGGLFGECSELRAADGSSQARSGVGGAHCARSADRGDSIYWPSQTLPQASCVCVACGVYVYNRAHRVVTYGVFLGD